MRRVSFLVWSVLFVVFFATSASAKGVSKIRQEFEQQYPAAEWHRALDNAYENLDPSKLKGYVVLMKGGIPAERAAYYISWGDYDYRGVTIDGEKVKTRRGKVYAFLQTGEVLAVSDVDHMGRNLYLKLITPDVYIPDNRGSDKHHSRVTVEIVYRLPKDVLKDDDAGKAMELLGEWFKPFKSIDDAKSFASTMPK